MYSADLAHLVERNFPKVEVAGSSPVIRSITASVLQFSSDAFLFLCKDVCLFWNADQNFGIFIG